jgi:ATP-dependent Lon protease
LELGDVPEPGGEVSVPTAMFPLGTVLFPYALLPLHVFEPRYRLMMNHVLAGDREFGVVLIERGHEVGGGDTRFDVATIARVVQAAELPDGRFAIATVGIRRVRVVRWLDDDPYPRAEVAAFDDPPPGAGDVAARDRAVAALEAVTAISRRIDPRVPAAPDLHPDPLRASYEAAALAPIGPLDAQRLLAASGAGARMRLFCEMVAERIVELRARFDLDDD